MAVLQLTDWSQETRQGLNDAHQVTLMLMGLNCLLDPIVYCFATRKFRKFIQSHLKKVRNGKACSTHTTTMTTNLSIKVRNPNELVSVFEEPEK